MKNELIDFHCHLDLYSDFPAITMECERAGVLTLAVTTTPRAWPRNRHVASTTRCVRAALGLHPQLVAKRPEEILLWEKYLPEARYVGEVGLDAGTRFIRSFDLQKQIFERVLQHCARAGGKILSVHSVRSAKVVLDMVEAHLPPPQGRVVMHWFTGSQADARRAVDLGCYFSVNAEMLAGDRHRATVVDLPLERLLTETDGPFTYRHGRPTQPADVTVVIEALAEARSAAPDDVAIAVRANLDRLEEQI